MQLSTQVKPNKYLLIKLFNFFAIKFIMPLTQQEKQNFDKEIN